MLNKDLNIHFGSNVYWREIIYAMVTKVILCLSPLPDFVELIRVIGGKHCS